MKILIVSDTHRYNNNFIDVLKEETPIDMLIHCGDVEDCEEFYYDSVDCDVHMVAGNNDIFSDLPTEEEFEICGHKIFLTHGHHYYVSVGTKILRQEALLRGADIVMYGHVHRPCVEEVSGITIINPGSLTYPRQDSRRPSYIVMEASPDGQVDFEIKYL